MQKNMKLFIVLFVIGLISLSFADGASDNPNSLLNKKIPSFSLKSTSNETIAFNDFRDKNSMLFVFSAKCPYSIESAKFIAELADEVENVNFFAICIDEEIGDIDNGGKSQEQAAKDFESKYFSKINKINVLLADETFRKDYADFFGYSAMNKAPIHMFVDTDSRLTEVFVGSTSKKNIENALEN